MRRVSGLPFYFSTDSRPLISLALALVLGSLLGALMGPSTAAAQTSSPSTTTAPYLTSHLPGMSIESILTVDDGSVPKTGGGTTRLVGIPDGMGVIDGADLSPPDPNYFYLLVNHELNSTQGITRDHGSAGAFVSKWRIDKVTHEVVEGDDLIKQFFDWDEGSSSFIAAPTTTFDRLCSADLPPPTAIYNSMSGLGSQEILYFNGEETFGGRVVGHVVTGADAGRSYHLEHLGFAAWENVILAPLEQDTTVAIMTDDDSDGEVYVYVGVKQSTGTEVEKAGLVGGNLYSLAVVGKPNELDNVIANALSTNAPEPFTLKLIGTPGDRPINGSDTEARGLDTVTPVGAGQNFESLKMGGPEDGVWDTRAGFENRFYFTTKGTSSNGINAPTRIWQLDFANMADPALGGTMQLLYDGPENRLGSLDNMTFEVVGGQPKLFVQEDLGGESRLSKVWEYDLGTGQLEEIASHDPEVFFEGGSAFLTTNEESSGIISLEDVLGAGWFAASIQVHTSSGLSSASELAEHGQLVLMNIASRGTDALRERIVRSGDSWDYRVDGVDPGSTWADVGFTVASPWNQTTAGTPTGPLPTSLGYGESAGVLSSDLVQPASPRAATSYFRHEFDLANPADVVLLDLYMKVDDGAVVYVNGVEVARYNMGLDLSVDNTTFASANEPSERDWKHIPINCESLALQATGNVIAVSLHQENDASSDIRLDLELIAWNDSPDAGAAPGIPAGVAVSNPTETSLDLSWTAQTDAKFFRIERQAAGDVAWEVVEAEYPGPFSDYVDTNVLPGVTYNYRLFAVNIHGRSDCSAIASGTTTLSAVPIIFEENFEASGVFGGFSVVDVLEPNAGWSQVLWDFGSTGAAQGNNFGGGNGPTEDWLILTDPINFLFYQNETIEYDSQISFSGPAPEVLYSTDYDPISQADPNLATWTLINTDTTSFGTLTPVGPFAIDAIDDTGYIAFKYTGNGGAGGQSVRWTIDDVLIKGDCGYDFMGAEDSDIEADVASPWTVVNQSSALGWIYDTQDGTQGAINNNFGSGPGGVSGGTAAEDWLISPELFVAGPDTGVLFDYYENFGDTLPQPLSVLVTDNYTGDPATTIWTDITPTGLDGSTSNAYIPVVSSAFSESGPNVRVAFRYESAGNGGGTTKRIGVDNVCITPLGGPLQASFSFNRSGGDVTFTPTVTGGIPAYTYDWDFGDGGTSSQAGPTHSYTAPGVYSVSLTVTDSATNQVVTTQNNIITVTSYAVPTFLSDLRIASFNTSMNRPTAGTLATALAAGTDPQIAAVAEVIQRANPDVVLLNEFDQILDASGNLDIVAMNQAIEDFKTNYLEVAQAGDTNAVVYGHHFVAPSNTGVPAGFDFNNDGDTTDPEDAYGFGDFPGQFGMVLLSKFNIEDDHVRTFRNFLWKDMPNAFLPPDPNDSDSNGDLTSYYTAAELDVFRLSSKSHWDVPISVPGLGLVHVLASHPTPPVFDDGEATVYPSPTLVDWNGLRNHDEIRFWADYVDPAASGYIYDDTEWADAGFATPVSPAGGLAVGARFVVVGDQNADPDDGDATFNPIQMLLGSSFVDASVAPTSAGALESVPGSFTNRETKTSSFNLRADYVLPRDFPSWAIDEAFVFWPIATDLEADVLSASDHRLVAIDLAAVPEPGLGAGLLAGLLAIGLRARRHGRA